MKEPIFSTSNFIDAYLMDERFPYPSSDRRPHTYWPSEASVEYADELGEIRLLGKCARAVFYSAKGLKATNPMDTHGLRIITVGKIIETQEQEWAKQAGIWYGSNVKFHHEYGPITISGEVDMFVRRADGIVQGVEFKSGYGYMFEKEQFGNTRVAPYPKAEHLMQVMLYIDHYQETSNLKYFTIVYVNRGDLSKSEHHIWLDPVSITTHTGELIETKMATVRSIVGQKDFEKVETRFTTTDIYNRYLYIDRHMGTDTVPARDYSIRWSSEKIEAEKEKGNISKSKYEKWQKKGVPIGDWRCSYCSFRELCYHSATPGGEYPAKDIPDELKPKKMRLAHAIHK